MTKSNMDAQTQRQHQFEIIVPKKNISLDATILSTLMSCARLTDFRYNLNMVSTAGKSPSLEKGSIVHKVLETYYSHIINGFNRDQSIGQALSAGKMYAMGCTCSGFVPSAEQPEPECKHKPDEYPGVKLDVKDVQWVLDTCMEYFKYYENDHWVPLEVEVTKGEVLYEDDEIRILWKAKLDLVVDTNQGIYPVDHKSMMQRRPTLSLNNQFMGQCLIQKTRGMFVNKIGLQQTLKPADKFQRVLVPYSIDRLLEWQSTILPYYAKLLLMYTNDGYWPPNFTHCESKYSICEFKDVCESNRDMREEELRNNFMVGTGWDV
jgi:hypothetical protein